MTLANSEESPFFYIVEFLRFYSRDGAGSSHLTQCPVGSVLRS